MSNQPATSKKPWVSLLWAILALGLVVAVVFVGVFLLPEWRRPPLGSPVPRPPTEAKLRNLALAMHGYAEEKGTLPPAAVYSRVGQPLLSWRVLILPYLGQRDLYQQFHLDEAWDSPHNHQLLARMPEDYAPTRWEAPAEPYTTYFQVFVGKGTAFEGRQGLRLADDFPDGVSNIFLIVEAGEAVPWTKPTDLAYAADQPLPRLGVDHRDGFYAALVDGSGRYVTLDVGERTIRAMIIRNGGENLGPDH